MTKLDKYEKYGGTLLIFLIILDICFTIFSYLTKNRDAVDFGLFVLMVLAIIAILVVCFSPVDVQIEPVYSKHLKNKLKEKQEAILTLSDAEIKKIKDFLHYEFVVNEKKVCDIGVYDHGCYYNDGVIQFDGKTCTIPDTRFEAVCHWLSKNGFIRLTNFKGDKIVSIAVEIV